MNAKSRPMICSVMNVVSHSKRVDFTFPLVSFVTHAPSVFLPKGVLVRLFFCVCFFGEMMKKLLVYSERRYNYSSSYMRPPVCIRQFTVMCGVLETGIVWWREMCGCVCRKQYFVANT